MNRESWFIGWTTLQGAEREVEREMEWMVRCGVVGWRTVRVEREAGTVGPQLQCWELDGQNTTRNTNHGTYSVTFTTSSFTGKVWARTFPNRETYSSSDYWQILLVLKVELVDEMKNTENAGQRTWAPAFFRYEVKSVGGNYLIFNFFSSPTDKLLNYRQYWQVWSLNNGKDWLYKVRKRQDILRMDQSERFH